MKYELDFFFWLQLFELIFCWIYGPRLIEYNTNIYILTQIHPLIFLCCSTSSSAGIIITSLTAIVGLICALRLALCAIISQLERFELLEFLTAILTGNLNYWVMHPVACVSIKYWNNLRMQQSIFGARFLLCTSHITCFGPVWRPSSGGSQTQKKKCVFSWVFVAALIMY
jgi:hypothetical protein